MAVDSPAPRNPSENSQDMLDTDTVDMRMVGILATEIQLNTRAVVHTAAHDRVARRLYPHQASYDWRYAQAVSVKLVQDQGATRQSPLLAGRMPRTGVIPTLRIIRTRRRRVAPNRRQGTKALG
jgi:hypothetical protein